MGNHKKCRLHAKRVQAAFQRVEKFFRPAEASFSNCKMFEKLFD